MKLQRREANTTIRDIAQALNLSHTTVSRVLNGKADRFISDSTRERVMNAVREMNYRPNHAARTLATGRSNMVALWSGDVFQSYYAVVTHYVEAVLRQRNKDMVYVATNRAHQEHSLNYTVDGILALGGVPEVITFLTEATSPTPPLVSMGCYVYREVDYVEVDLGPGTRTAVHHLFDMGCQRVAYFVSDFGMQPGDARRLAYEEVVRDRGKQPEFIRVRETGRADGRETIKRYIVEHGRPDGIFCFNDDIALGVYRGLRDLGLHVPEDILLIGCDGIEDTEYLDTPLSTVVQPYEEMCTRAWAMLERRMREPGAPALKEVLTAQFALRESAIRQ